VRLPRRPHIDENWQPKLYVRIAALAILVGYAIAFVLENGKHVNVHFVLATAGVSLVWVILLSFGIGVVAGILLAQLERRRRRRRAGNDGGKSSEAVVDLDR
jgi:uncharacterized integral membrane protein